MLSEKSWQRLLWRAGQRPYFLAYSLQIYQKLHDLSAEELATRLGCSPEDLVKLALCRRPAKEPPLFKEEVERISSYCMVDPMTLAKLLREVEALEVFLEPRVETESEKGFLIAAREKDQDDDGAEKK